MVGYPILAIILVYYKKYAGILTSISYVKRCADPKEKILMNRLPWKTDLLKLHISLERESPFVIHLPLIESVTGKSSYLANDSVISARKLNILRARTSI